MHCINEKLISCKGKSMKQLVVDRNEMGAVAQELLALDARVWTFTGTLGAGKTTLVQEMLALLGQTGPVQSPTYTYVTTYILPDNRVLYHFDLYRLSSYNEFIQAGFDEYLYDESSLCFIEWPEIILPYLPEKTVQIILEYLDDGTRAISF